MTLAMQERPASRTGRPTASSRLDASLPGTSDSYTREYVEWLVEFTYQRGLDDGFAQGVEHARLRMDDAIREAIDPGPEVNPGARNAVLNRSAKAVVESLIDAMNRGLA